MMDTRISFISILVVVSPVLSYNCCRNDWCEPPQNKFTEDFYQADEETALPSSEAKGCNCKENFGKYVYCCGPLCHHVPTKLNFTTPQFEIISSQIVSINRGDFSHYTYVQILKIESNDHLLELEEFVFEDLPNVLNLSISYNHKLKYLKPNTFVGLHKLTDLFLKNNAFISLGDISASLSARFMPNLDTLILSDNWFSRVTSYDFRALKNAPLKELDLMQCKIDNIDPDSFLQFKQLEELHLGYSHIQTENLTKLFVMMQEAEIPLKFLSLYRMGLSKGTPKTLFEAIDNMSVECLNIGENLYDLIDKNTFPRMKNIRMLDFRGANVIDITEDAFDNVDNLEILLLGNNKLSRIPLGARRESIKYMCVKHNAELVRSSIYFAVNNFTFTKMKNIESLDMSHNSIRSIFNATFFGLSSLKVLNLRKCDIRELGPGAFSPLKNLEFLDLESNLFLQYEHNPFETDIFEGLYRLEVLYLGYNNIHVINNMTFSSLTNLKQLHLNENLIKHLDYTYFRSMPRLSLLNFDKNALVSWNSRLFPDNKALKTLQLSNNRIEQLTPAMLEDFRNITELSLGKNLLKCICEQYGTFKKWYVGAKKVKKVIEILDNSSAKCYPSDKNVTSFLLDSNNDNLCRRSYIPIIVPCSLLLVLLIVSAVLLYHYRWYWRYYLFLTRLHLIRKGKRRPSREKDSQSNYEYDAFVSYSNEDSNFVLRLVSMLEKHEPFLKLCVYERDFKIGSIISESILENVTKSRKILLIISESYVKSHWCQWETHIAQHCNLFFKDDNGDFADDSLILIKFGLVNEKNLTPTLKYLLKTRIYLQWDKDENKQGVFWKKLKENLIADKVDHVIKSENSVESRM